MSVSEAEQPVGVFPTSAVASERFFVAQWRQLNAEHGRIEDALTRALGEVGLSLVEFTVLDIIRDQVNGHLRMQDVAVVAGLTTGATTRLVNRLEDRQLLRRVLCDYDRRGIYTELTETGRELVGRARSCHDAALGDALATSTNPAITALSRPPANG
jgi:DNA-binding MarR family transcriptional regulator